MKNAPATGRGAGDFSGGNVPSASSRNGPKTQPPKGIVTGFSEALGELYAAFDQAAAHVDPGVRTSRFAAWLAPFPNQQLAELALIAAGAVIGGGR